MWWECVGAAGRPRRFLAFDEIVKPRPRRPARRLTKSDDEIVTCRGRRAVPRMTKSSHPAAAARAAPRSPRMSVAHRAKRGGDADDQDLERAARRSGQGAD